MPDEKKDETKIDVAAITKAATESAVKAVTEAFKPQFEELAKNQKILGDTLAADAQKRADDVAAAAGAKGKDPKDGKADATAVDNSPEAVAKRTQEAVDAALKKRDDEAAVKTQRQQLVDKFVKEKLGGDAELGKLLTGADEKSLGEQADAISTRMKIKPAIAGAQGDGGLPPGGKAEPAPINPNLSPGVAKLAAAYGGPSPATTA